MERIIKVSHSGNTNQPKENGSNNNQSVVLKPTGDQPETFTGMQQQMEDELERRRKDWEKEVEKMQEDFFNIKVNKDSDMNANKSIDVELANGAQVQAVKKAPGNKADIFEISNAKNIYNKKPDGTEVVTFKFDVSGFDPSAITVRAEGSKITVCAQYEEEHFPGNKSTRRHNRQVDIPPGVNPDNFMSYLSADGILTVEAPVTEKIPEEEPQVIEIIGGNAYVDGVPLELEYGGPRDGSRMTTTRYGGSAISPELEYGGLGGTTRTVRTTNYSGSPELEFGGLSGGTRTVRNTNYSGSPELEYGGLGGSTRTVRTTNYGGSLQPHTTHTTHIRSVSPRSHKVPTNTVKGNTQTIIQPKKSEYTTTTPGGTVIVRSTESGYSPFGSESSMISQNTYDQRSPLGRNALGGKSCYGHPNVITTEEGQRCKITVNIGTNYNPEEISVQLHYKKIIVKALHEEVIGGRSSKSEFSREFDIPSPIEPRTFKAVVSRDGKLTIGGSLKDNKNHDEVMTLVLCDMPLNGRSCKVIVD